MNHEILFSERQRMTQGWLLGIGVVLIGINMLCFFGIYQQVFGGQPFGNKPSSDTELIS